jgi:GTPase Era involved in 16S rRNA processing
MGECSSFHAGEVAVVGRPNVGKSTLVNRLVGEKVAIVSDKPQTTRKRVLGVARLPDAEIALVDTPGIHRPHFRMNAAMVRDAATPSRPRTSSSGSWMPERRRREGVHPGAAGEVRRRRSS